MKVFDIEVNGETKASYGKGYHSYLNTVVALAFRNYFHDRAKYNADFLIIDTPLHGFDENDTELPDSMKDGLFKYFVNHLTGQLIIVEIQTTFRVILISRLSEPISSHLQRNVTKGDMDSFMMYIDAVFDL